MSRRSYINYWKVPKVWAGESCFILAGGPSLRGFNSSVLRDQHVIAINNAVLDLAPWAEVLYFCDEKWWRWHGKQVLASFHGRWIVTPALSGDHFKTIELVNMAGLEKRQDALRSGHNSGYQAINLAYHLGANPIVLLGYDMAIDFERGLTHYHQGHPTSIPADRYMEMLQTTMQKNMVPKFPALQADLAAEGVQVLNANPNSALKCFPFTSLEEILCESACTSLSA